MRKVRDRAACGLRDGHGGLVPKITHGLGAHVRALHARDADAHGVEVRNNAKDAREERREKGDAKHEPDWEVDGGARVAQPRAEVTHHRPEGVGVQVGDEVGLACTAEPTSWRTERTLQMRRSDPVIADLASNALKIPESTDFNSVFQADRGSYLRRESRE